MVTLNQNSKPVSSFQKILRKCIDDVTHKKNASPKQKIFFRVQSTRLADPFEPLNSSLAQWVEELGRW